MKKRFKALTSVILSLVLLCAVPHAFAAADGLNPAILERLKAFQSICESVRAEGFALNSEEAFEEAETAVISALNNSALNNSALTDEAAVAVLQSAGELLRSVEISSVYGLAYPLETYYQFDDALFRDRFAYPYQYEDWDERVKDRETYEELYHHFTGGRLDWVLAHTTDSNPQPIECYVVLGNRLLRRQCGDLPFAFGYSVYDVETQRFLSLTQAYDAYERGGFEGLENALRVCGVGEPLGDLNSDGKLEINDATMLQRCLAEMEHFPVNDKVDGFDIHTNFDDNITAYVSDVNRNGRHDIGDVTAIQRILAEIE